MRTRAAKHGRGIHEQAWKETKVAALWKMTGLTFDHDPHPEPPRCFRDQRRGDLQLGRALGTGHVLDDRRLARWSRWLIKELNQRVKGTEQFWNRPTTSEGELILQVAASLLSDGDPLTKQILARPGSLYYP